MKQLIYDLVLSRERNNLPLSCPRKHIDDFFQGCDFKELPSQSYHQGNSAFSIIFDSKSQSNYKGNTHLELNTIACSL